MRKELAAAKFAQAKLPPRMEIHKESEQEKSAKAKEEVLPPFKPQVCADSSRFLLHNISHSASHCPRPVRCRAWSWTERAQRWQGASARLN